MHAPLRRVQRVEPVRLRSVHGRQVGAQDVRVRRREVAVDPEGLDVVLFGLLQKASLVRLVALSAQLIDHQLGVWRQRRRRGARLGRQPLRCGGRHSRRASAGRHWLGPRRIGLCPLPLALLLQPQPLRLVQLGALGITEPCRDLGSVALGGGGEHGDLPLVRLLADAVVLAEQPAGGGGQLAPRPVGRQRGGSAAAGFLVLVLLALARSAEPVQLRHDPLRLLGRNGRRCALGGALLPPLGGRAGGGRCGRGWRRLGPCFLSLRSLARAIVARRLLTWRRRCAGRCGRVGVSPCSAVQLAHLGIRVLCRRGCPGGRRFPGGGGLHLSHQLWAVRGGKAFHVAAAVVRAVGRRVAERERLGQLVLHAAHLARREALQLAVEAVPVALGHVRQLGLMALHVKATVAPVTEEQVAAVGPLLPAARLAHGVVVRRQRRGAEPSLGWNDHFLVLGPDRVGHRDDVRAARCGRHDVTSHEGRDARGLPCGPDLGAVVLAQPHGAVRRHRAPHPQPAHHVHG
mmetsp:Transcript_22710/g.73532  ORF Transcript_22710/g.73532 Transcript_22710/m.73532 type:complete len:516 (+) Transcript_22710:1950-3497(+)